jgi:phosphoribosylformylglycinamidine cyclo-ligase
MGVGWVAIVGADDVQKACAAGPGGFVLGTMRPGDGVSVKISHE